MIIEEVSNNKQRPTSDEYFEKSACFVCNGYYGPCFEDPACATCHAFLFPDFVQSREILSEVSESDDGDSGNDEPADSPYPTPKDRSSPAAPQRNEDILSHRLELLSNPNTHLHKDYDVERLPPEVLLSVFVYLDELSLWSVGSVCRRWQYLMQYLVSSDRWKKYTQRRWPLFKTVFPRHDWFEVYSSLITSCWCLKCLGQMSMLVEPPGQENSWREHRLGSELKYLRLDPPEGIEAKPLDRMCCHWQATISGPKGSPYEGGLFYLYLQVPYTYPMCPPVVRFLTRIFHPNVSRHGDIGIDSIHHNWSLALTISKVLISIQSLLTDPYCEICMEPTVGTLYLKDRAAFEKQAREWTWKYAMHDVMPNKKLV